MTILGCHWLFMNFEHSKNRYYQPSVKINYHQFKIGVNLPAVFSISISGWSPVDFTKKVCEGCNAFFGYRTHARVKEFRCLVKKNSKIPLHTPHTLGRFWGTYLPLRTVLVQATYRKVWRLVSVSRFWNYSDFLDFFGYNTLISQSLERVFDFSTSESSKTSTSRPSRFLNRLYQTLITLTHLCTKTVQRESLLAKVGLSKTYQTHKLSR